MTSHPARFFALETVLLSMASQTHKIDRLVLNISQDFEAIFPKSLYELNLPFDLNINFCADEGPGTKYIPTLRKFPKDAIITIDDDHHYSPNLISMLISTAKHAPNSIVVGRSREARFIGAKPAPYHLWPRAESVNKSNRIFMPSGTFGCLIPPDALHEDILDTDLYTELSFSSSSPWLWVQSLRKLTPVVQIDSGNLHHLLIDGTEGSALYLNGNSNLLYDFNLLRLWEHFDMVAIIADYIAKFDIEIEHQQVPQGTRSPVLSQFLVKYLENVPARDRLGFVGRTLNRPANLDTGSDETLSFDSTNSSQEIDFINKEFSKVEKILEFGSGASTLIALKYVELEIVSVETSLTFISALEGKIDSSNLPKDNLHIFFADIGPVKEWGRPNDRNCMEKWLNYSYLPYFFIDVIGFTPDLIFIDGRFRISTFCQAFLQFPGALIMFDDYFDRTKYSVVERLILPSGGVGRIATFEIPKNPDLWTRNLATNLLVENLLDDD
jgi:hypothetical protein